VSFVADQLSATFATNFSSVINQGKARDTTTDATVQTFNAGATGPVRLLASANRLHVDATDFQVGGQLTVQKDKLNWVQEGGTAGYKLSAANDTYLYTHGATGALSSGVRNFNLDAYNVDNALMGSGGFSFKSFDNAGAAVEVLKMEAGADPTAGQNVSFLNSNLGVGVAGSSAYKLNVAGASNLNGNTSVTGSLAVTGDLTVSGTLTTVNSTEVSVRDRNITLASGATSVAQLDTGGIQLGTDPAYQVNFQYNDAVAYKAWQSNVNIDVAAGKDFTIAGGATNPNGMTLDSSHLTFYDPTTALKIGANDVLLSKTGLSFADPLATINFGGTVSSAHVILCTCFTCAASNFFPPFFAVLFSLLIQASGQGWLRSHWAFSCREIRALETQCDRLRRKWWRNLHFQF
jgi:hypothetical protein